jgi:hypothetical protein
MESVIKQLDKLVNHLEAEVKGIDHQIADANDTVYRLKILRAETETKMLETAAAMDFLKKSRSEINDVTL